jgi:hypothetical protein
MRALSTALLGVAVAAAPALAQEVHKYDPEAEVTITGVVVDFHESKAKNDHPGLHFVLEIPVDSAEAPAAPEPAAPEPAAPEPAAPEPASVGEASAGLEPDAAAPAEVTEASPPAPAETVEVHACPLQFLSLLDFPVENGDEITVTGSRPEGSPVLIARMIKKGAVELQVRDEKGVPIWDELR